MRNDTESSEEEDAGTLTRLTTQPTILDGGDFVLRDYQLDGLNWMIGLNETGILAENLNSNPV